MDIEKINVNLIMVLSCIVTTFVVTSSVISFYFKMTSKLDNVLSRLNKSESETWTKLHSKLWISLFKQYNPTLRVPTVKEVTEDKPNYEEI